MFRRWIRLSALATALFASATGAVALASAHATASGPCGGLAVAGTSPDTANPTARSSVQFGCLVTFTTFTVTTNHTLVAKTIGSQKLPFVLYPGGQSRCTLHAPHSFACTVPAQKRGSEVKAFFAESQGCAGLQVSVTVSGKVSKIPVNGACK